MALTELPDGTLLHEDGTVYSEGKAAPVEAVTETESIAEVVEVSTPKAKTKTK